jgi:protein O-mannosyl-transferase
MNETATAAADLSATERRWRAGVALVLAVVTLAVFMPALDAEFVDWDDHVNLVQNTAYRGISWAHLRWMATTTLMGHYIPLTWLSFGVDYVVWGMDPRGYHFTNVVLHMGSVLTFFAVALRLLHRAMALGAGARLLGAATAALFFAVHPLRAESVAWVTERRDVLSGLFFLLTILGYLAAQDTPSRTRRRLLLAASVAASVAAVAAKAIVMGLPLVLLILDIYPLRRFDRAPGGWRRARAVLVEKIPYAIVGAGGAAVAYYVVKMFTVLTPIDAFPWSGRIVMVFYTFWFYVTRTLAPMALSPLYELPAHVSLREPRFALPALAVTAVTIALVALRKRWPAGLAAWASYIVILAPVSGIVHAGFQLAHDRYSYLSCLGWALLVGGAVGALAERREIGGGLRRVALAATGAWLLALAWLGWQQVHVWHDSHALWTHALDSDPECALCHANLAAYLVNHGDVAGGSHHAQRAIVLRPERPRPYATLGLALVKSGRPAAAIPYFERFLREVPASAETLSSLGVALLRAGYPREALGPLGRAIALKPDDVLIRVNAATALVALGERDGALAEYRAALARDPRSAEARYATGRALATFGDTEGAKREHRILSTLDVRLAANLARDIAAARP